MIVQIDTDLAAVVSPVNTNAEDGGGGGGGELDKCSGRL